MIVKSYPAKHSIESGRSFIVKNFGRRNILFNARGKQAEYNNLLSPLSLKYTLQGEEWYQVDGTDLMIDNRNFLMLNNQQTYSSYVQSDTEVESFCIFFKDGLFDEVYTHEISPAEDLLNDPGLMKSMEISFIEKRYPMSVKLKRILGSLRMQLDHGDFDNIYFESYIYQILRHLTDEFLKTSLEIEQLPFKRKSTRIELYRRLHRARDYIDSTFKEDLDLEDVARVACLSKYHFLRSFRSVFGIAPHQYISVLRTEKAKDLLRTNLSISQICQEVGFINESSFSRHFKKYTGLTPSAYKSGKI